LWAAVEALAAVDAWAAAAAVLLLLFPVVKVSCAIGCCKAVMLLQRLVFEAPPVTAVRATSIAQHKHA
jgi:hypothetical protein